MLREELFCKCFEEGEFSLTGILTFLRTNRITKLLVAGICILSMMGSAAVVLGADEVSLQAQSAILMENSTGKILYEKNIHERRPMASITKIMTMLLLMEEIDKGNIKYDDIITGSAHAKSMGGSTIYLDEGEQLTVRDMLKGIAVASGNDAAVAVAEHISGSEPAFVDRMNQRAAELGMVNTHFVNSNGLDADGHYSTAYDIALMSRELLKHPDIHNFTTIWMDTLRDGKFTLSNTNKLIRFYNGATGLKTGSTSKALFCVSATAKRDNMHLISVTMASPSNEARVADASALLNYGFANHSILNVATAGEVAGEYSVSKGVKDSVEIVISSPFDYLIRKGNKGNIEKRFDVPSKIVAPVNKGDKAGKVEYYYNDMKIGEGDLIFNESIEKANFFETLAKIFRSWFFRENKK